ncbi:MAG: Ig-like domain-containing protein [Actinomycetaceae bacterium]|nr:Ig-like domain-containing protein [Actinomycetaceae bacterium]
MSKRTQRIVSAGATAAIVAGYIAAVSSADGIDRAELSLNDGGVWVTNHASRLVGHLNYPSLSIDAGVRADSAKFDIFQEDDTVLVRDYDAGTLTPVDAAKVSMGTPHSLNETDTVAFGGGNIGMLDSQAGKVWATPADELAGFDSATAKPGLTGMAGGAIAVGKDGSVHAASTESRAWASMVVEGSTFRVQKYALPDGVAHSEDLQIAAVGKKPVLLAGDSGTVVLPSGREVDLGDTKNLQLQQSGPESDDVLVASASTLYKVSLSDGDIEKLPADPDDAASAGSPSRPVFHQGCSYAAWAGTGRFVRDCPDDSDDLANAVPTLKTTSAAEFRTNRRIIVLNDAATGNVWLPDKDMVLVNNWDDVNQNNEVEDEQNDDSTDLNTQQQDPDRQEENHPPEAADDTFGVRPGRTTSLPVTANDTDQDGDVLTVSATSEPGFGTVRPSRGGQALQVDVPEDATGSTTFTYEADDGRGGVDQATVTLEVHPFGVNAPPVQQIQTTAKLSSGGETTLQALGDWVDPDGDPIYLQSAVGEEGLSVNFEETGTIKAKDLNLGPATRRVKLAVSDGSQTSEGELAMDVTEGVNHPPRANADYVRVLVGESGTVDPLANDVDPNGEQLSLVGTGPAPEGLTVKSTPNLGNITVSSDTPGTRYLTYFVSDGPSTSTGIIRVDVVESDAQSPPVVEDDIALLPSGSQALIDVLSNDSDPAGGVLTLQSVELEDGSPLVVSPVNHELARVTAPGGLSEPTHVTYTVSNGAASASARIMVIPVAAPDTSQAPQLVDDQLTVRAGDVGSVAVLDNDHSPGKLTMTVASELQHSTDPQLGEPFVSDNVVRFRAGQKTGSTRLVYTVRDSLGNVSSANVTVNVLPVDEENNTAPSPPNVTGRAIVDQSVTIPVALDGIDAEGDSVEIVGLGDSPSLGVADIGTSSITYTPSQPGTDSFTYTVRDSLGKTATARVRIGVAPQPGANQEPVTTKDQILARPSTNVLATVTDNDIDPDGDPVSLVADSAASDESSVGLRQRGNAIVVSTPKAEGSYPVRYRIKDGRGGFADGLLTVNVSADAPHVAPVARDDAVAHKDAYGKKKVAVNVLANDEDKDGDILESTVSSKDPGVKVNSDKSLTIDTDAKPRVVLYTVKDPTGLESSAIVRVPSNTENEPTVDPDKVPISVEAGKTKTIKINDFIVSKPGTSVIITDPEHVQASVGWDGNPLVVDERTLKFTPLKDFSGPTSITLEVTDGKERNDSSGTVKRLTLPIEVKSSGNRPPVFTPTKAVVEAGGDKAAIDLASMTTDPDAGDDPSTFSYRVTGKVDGVKADVAGSKLTLSAQSGASAGTTGSLQVTVSDGKSETTGTLPVEVVTTNRPLIQVGEISRTVDAGGTVKVDVAAEATNPFPDEPLRLAGQPSVISGQASVRASGTVLEISAPQGASGEALVGFQLADKTGDASRTVRGTVRLTINGRPDPVSNVTAEVVDKNSAVVKWTNGSPNGSPFTKFTVHDLTDGDTTDCPVGSQCVISGRTLGKKHSFEVVAHNSVGASDAARSGEIMMDVAPATPGPPTASAGDGTVTFTWSPSASDGSQVDHYVVNVTGLGSHTVSGTSLQLDSAAGVRNGQQYSATVTAVNRQGNSGTSPASNAVTPFGRPGSFTASAENTTIGQSGSAGKVRVSWTVPDGNGRPIESYTITPSVGSPVRISDPNATSHIFDIPYSSAPVSFTVTATNSSASGSSTSSNAASVTVKGAPSAPSGGSVRATGNSGQLAVTAPSGGTANGWTQGEIFYQMSVNGGAWQPVGDITGQRNGSDVSVAFRAVATSNGQRFAGPSSAAVQAVPYGQPVSPSISCTPQGSRLACSWQGGDHAGRSGRFLLSSDGDTREVPASGSMEVNVRDLRDWKVCVRAEQTSPSSQKADKKCVDEDDD